MKAMRKLAWVEAKLFLREPLALLIAFAFPFFMLFILTGVFGNEVELDPEEAKVWRSVGPSDYYVSTYVGLVMASVGLVTLPLRLAGYREQGVLRRYRAAGMPLVVVLGSQVIVSAAMSIIAGVGIVVVSTLAYGTVLPDSWWLVGVAGVIGLVTFSAIGVFLGAVLPSARAVQGVGIALFFVMMLISGSGPPRDVLTGSMNVLSNAMPLTHLNWVLQDAWLGHGFAAGHALLTLTFAGAASVLSLRFFRWE